MYFTQWRKVWFAKWIVKWWAPWKPRCLKWYTVRRILSRHRNRCSSARHARAPQPISHRRIPRPPQPFGFSQIPARRHGTSPSLSRWRAMASSSSSSPAPALAGEALRQKRILSSKLYLEVPSSKVGRGHRPISSFQDTRELSLFRSQCFLAGAGGLLAGIRHLLPRAWEAVSCLPACPPPMQKYASAFKCFWHCVRVQAPVWIRQMGPHL